MRVLFVVLLLLSCQSYAECVMKVRVNDVPPQYMLKDGQWVGKAVELINVLLNEANCRAEFLPIPWERALIELKEGRVDVMMNVSYSKQRETDYYLIPANTYQTTILLMRKNIEIDIQSLNDLKKLPMKIGYEPGNLFDKTFMDKFNEDASFRDAFIGLDTGDMTKMTVLGRLSGELTMLDNAKYALENHPEYRDEIYIHPMTISKLPSFFAFSKQSISPQRIIELQAANVRALSKGAYQEVIKRWN